VQIAIIVATAGKMNAVEGGLPMSTAPKNKYTEAEYLAMERDSDIKHEFYRGEIFAAMAGSYPDHNRIVVDIYTSLHGQLKKSPCEIFSSEIRVRVNPTRSYTYPDIKVVCGEQEFTKDNPPSLLNPTLIIEVLSPSTAEYDRAGKSFEYRKLTSLQEYILIAQHEPRVEHYVRQPNEKWSLTDITGLEAAIGLKSIPCTLALADIYSRVSFAE
jgi:Uma2 family endonuclease